jgi:hypothetical protein
MQFVSQCGDRCPYHPSDTTSAFLIYSADVLDRIATLSDRLHIVGDLNICFDRQAI